MDHGIEDSYIYLVCYKQKYANKKFLYIVWEVIFIFIEANIFIENQYKGYSKIYYKINKNIANKGSGFIQPTTLRRQICLFQLYHKKQDLHVIDLKYAC
jgi:hypothetical protein